MRTAAIGLGVMMVAAAVVPAGAQVNPFRSGRYGSDMPPGDMKAFTQSVDQLNRMPHLKVGSRDSWTNPETGSSGTNTVQRIFHSSGMLCHGLQHQMAGKDQSNPRSFTLSWCQTPQGQWKTKG